MEKKQLPINLSIAWLREKYLSKEHTPAGVIATIIERADEDAAMNIWITPPSLALIQPYLDRLQFLDPVNTPLWGVPFAIKDNIDLAGVPTTAGCPDYAYTPDNHAAVVARMIAAGAIPLGKTNLDQFATGLVGTRSPYGETHNALRPELISGGSSSGSAVAVARGQAAFAFGTDTAGSGRVPAALNELVGYKPTVGAWSTKGVVPACASLDCVTVLAHSLDDALAVDRMARGVEDADPWSRHVAYPEPMLPAKLCLPNKPLQFFGPFATEYRSAWETAVERLKALNLPVEYVDCQLFSEAAAILYGGAWIAERWAGLGDFVDTHPGVVFPVTEQVLRSGAAEKYEAVSVFQAMHKLQAYKLQARKLLEGAVLAMPTAGGTWTRDEVRQNPSAANSDMGLYTNHCNLLDLCAAAVPSDRAAADLPFGITLFALANNEGLICGAAELFMHRTSGLAAAKNASDPPTAPPTASSLTSQISPAASTTISSPAVQASLSASPLSSQAAAAATLTGSPTASPVPMPIASATALSAATSLVAVCGLHMRGYPLEKQMQACRARFVREAITAAKYQMVKLPTAPAKPGLIKRLTGGSSIRLELWEMPLEAFGAFAASIPAPLGIGKVELEDGTEVPGFVCEAYAADGAEDITAAGGWRNIT